MTTQAATEAEPVDEPQGPEPARSGQALALRAARQKLCMTQEILAGAAGVSARTVMRAERGDEISAENLRAICAVLGLDAGGLAQPTPEPIAGGPRSPTDDVPEDALDPASTPSPVTLTRRLILLSLAMLVLTGWANMTVGLVGTFVDTMGPARQRSGLQGTLLAKRVNVAMALLAKGDVSSPPDMGSRSYPYDACTAAPVSDWILGHYGDCRMATRRLEVRRADRDGIAFSLGPVDATLLGAFAMQLRDDPAIRFQMLDCPITESHVK